MKQIIILLGILVAVGKITAEQIYSRTTLLTTVGDCMVYQTTFWGDNNTSTNSEDDRYLGVDYLMDCPDNKIAPDLVPDFTHSYFHPTDAKGLQQFSFSSDGNILLPPFVSYIPYQEYLSRVQQKQLIISKLPAKEVPNFELPGKIRRIQSE